MDITELLRGLMSDTPSIETVEHLIKVALEMQLEQTEKLTEVIINKLSDYYIDIVKSRNSSGDTIGYSISLEKK